MNLDSFLKTNESKKASTTSILDYWELSKPRLVFLVLISTAIGFFMAVEGPFPFALFLTTLAGTSFVAASSMVLNQWMEKDIDELMVRTQNRPIPSGRVEPVEALGFGLTLAVIGLGILEIAVGTLTSFLAAATLLSYLILYTPLKRTTSWCTWVGAIPGALPPLIGWSAVQAPIPVEAWVLFSIMFIWQMPHFFAISWLYRDDYRRANVKVLSTTSEDSLDVFRSAFFLSCLLVPISLIPTWIGMNGYLYFFGAAFLGILQSAIALQGFYDKDRGAKYLFRASIVYLTLLFILMAVDKA